MPLAGARPRTPDLGSEIAAEVLREVVIIPSRRHPRAWRHLGPPVKVHGPSGGFANLDG